MSHYLGIDFGSHSNLIVRWNDKKKCIENVPIFSEYGASIYTFPDVLYYEKSGNIVVGRTAYNAFLNNSENIISDIKNNLGRKNGLYIPNLKRKVEFEEAARDLSSYIDATLRKKSADMDSVAVISVPYTYTKHQKDLLKKAFTDGGIKVSGIISSPVAAILGFGLLKTVMKNKNVFLVDIGENEYRMYFIKINKDENEKFIIDIAGTEFGNKGGRDIDIMISRYIAKCLNTDISKYKDKAYIMNLAESIKEHLTYFKEYDENPIICGKAWKNNITSEQLGNMIKKSGFTSELLHSAFRLLKETGIDSKNIDDIILIGGVTNIPVIRKELSNFFHKEISSPTEPDKESKILEGEGAAKYCGMLKNGNVGFTVINRCICDIGIKCGEEDKLMVSKGSECDKFSPTAFFRLSDENDNTICIYNKLGLKRCVRFSKSGTIGVQLGNTSDGGLMYKFTNENGKIISEGIVGGV